MAVIIAMLQTGLCRQEREATFLYIVFNMDSTTRYHLCVPLIALPGTAYNKANRGTQTVLGVKGLAWFSYLLDFDNIRGVEVVYMHCDLLGDVKMLT